ncbi:Lon protease family protein [Kangiella shandongensis]|uniref:Lon protease family protein n=1 Tax=Kangiella shandongensis TaxID=2763258 RepID=UPI001CC0A3C9|nr:AAA family ATPase [Kangiella shandongensis]
MSDIKTLSADQLRVTFTAENLQFETTAELKDISEMLGQDRALKAMRFGTDMPNSGYNLYALGQAGVGKHTAISRYLKEKASSAEVPPDWIYVNNFKDATKPRSMRLPAGRGKMLRMDMQELVAQLKTTIPAAFESKEYKARIDQINSEFEEKQQAAFTQLTKDAEEKHVKVLQSPGEFTFAPTKDGKTMDSEEFQKLSEEEKESISENIKSLEEQLQDILHVQIPKWRKEEWQLTKKVNDEVTLNTVRQSVDPLRKKYVEFESIGKYLYEVEEDVIDNVDLFAGKSESRPSFLEANTESALQRYEVNVLVDHNKQNGAPVIYEANPNYTNLLGRVEHSSELGTLVTNFTLIKPGALHCANGGYLLLEAHKLLMQPFAWEALKQALYSKEVRIQSLDNMLSMVSTISLEPESIPLNVKVVLIGERLLYYLLAEYDSEFKELFKVAVDFEDNFKRADLNEMLYAHLLATLIRKHQLLDFERDAVAAVIEQSMRMTGDSEKFSAHMGHLINLLSESSFWAGESDRDIVEAKDVKRAITEQIDRSDRIRDRIQEAILRGTVMIDTDNAVVGQTNGLSVIKMGEASFGFPTRITATTRSGEGNLVDIEREVELGGPIHSKGVYILSSYLGARYSQLTPLSLTASITFEQSYGGVEGDSASLAELCSLLSSLSKLPIKQSLAITGSVNQHGKVQAIGGVNEKIEGFFDICQQRGLNGDQGVLIPAANVKHLMLHEDVVEAVREEKFSVYAISNVDEAITLLTGVDAGQADKEGSFKDGTVNQRVCTRLQAFADIRSRFGSKGNGKNKA